MINKARDALAHIVLVPHDLRRDPVANHHTLSPMISSNSFAIVLVTTPTAAVARKLARAALEQRLIACANIVPHVESMYWWEGKIESGKEVLMVMKSRKPLLPKLETLIEAAHPYDTPEILVLPLSAGSRRYLEWLRVETG